MVKLKLLLTIVVSTLIATCAWAQDDIVIDYSKWMSQLDEDTPLTSLSIPCAHDAATWSWNQEDKFKGALGEIGGAVLDVITYLADIDLGLTIKDQDLDEREMFKRGVRAFDMRLNRGHFIHGSMIDPLVSVYNALKEWTYYKFIFYNMGIDESDLRSLSNYFCKLNSFDEELSHMPTLEELGQETLFIWFKEDGEFEKDTEKTTLYNDFTEFARKLNEYYKGNVVTFRKGMKLKDVRGKIIVFNNNEMLAPGKYEQGNMAHASFPLPLTVSKSRENEQNWTIYDYAGNCEPLYGYSQDHYNTGSASEKLNYFTEKMELYFSHIDLNNTQQLINYAGVNAYSMDIGYTTLTERKCGAEGVAADRHIEKIGANHLVADYLETQQKPFGFVAFDYCGSDDNNKNGYNLLKTIVKNNFKKKDLKYISDLVLCKGSDTQCAELLKKEGYEMLDCKWTCYDQKSNIRFGVKYTENPNEALSADVRLCEILKGTSVRDSVVNNIKYKYIRKYVADDDKKYNGAIDFYLGGSEAFDYYLYVKSEPDPNDKLLTSFDLIRTRQQSVAKMIWYCEECHPDKVAALEESCNYGNMNHCYFELGSHGHIYELTSSAEKDFMRCLDCGFIDPTSVQDHDFYYTVEKCDGRLTGKHVSTCRRCNYTSIDPCETEEFTDESNGFGNCTICNAYVYQPAEKRGGVYQIANAGQLYWFSDYTTYVNPKADAVLLNNIVVNQDADIRVPGTEYPEGRQWWPIAYLSKEKREEFAKLKGEEKLKYADKWVGYKGTFDGKGHSISGLYINANKTEAQEGGLFYYINGGTVKNVGIENAEFSTRADNASFALYAQNAKLSNIYSTAYIYNGAGMVVNLTSSELTNGYYHGHLGTHVRRNENLEDICQLIYSTEQPLYGENIGNVITNFYAEKGICYVEESRTHPRIYHDPLGFTPVPSSDFENGCICVLLNSAECDSTNMWRQELGKDKNPRFGLSDNYMVYGGYEHGGKDLCISNEYSDYLLAYKHPRPFSAEETTELEGNHDKSYEAECTWTDNEDKTDVSLSVKFTCSVCGHSFNKDIEHEDIEHDGDKQNIEMTCLVDGHNYYVSKYSFNDNASLTFSYDQKIPALAPEKGHDYASSNGFGCARCGMKDYHPAEVVMRDDQEYYQISNGGQLYWFSDLTNSETFNGTANAVLTNDIVINEDMTKSEEELRKWTPICSTNAYSGTFDGNGHTISGIYSKDHVNNGLFGNIYNGNIKSLGIINSTFVGGTNIGSFVGKTDEHNPETNNCFRADDVFSTANIINTSESGVYGGFVGWLGESKVFNAYYDGEISSTVAANDTKYIFGRIPDNRDQHDPSYFAAKKIYVREGKYGNNGDDNIEALSDADFTSGKLCYLLNKNKYEYNSVWHQNIEERDATDGYQVDAAPVLNSTHYMVVPAEYNGRSFINLNVDYYDVNRKKISIYSRKTFEPQDKVDYYCPVDFTVEKASYVRKMASNSYGTICLPFAVETSKDVKYYQLSNADKNGNYSFVEVETLPANTPGLVYRVNNSKNDDITIEGIHTKDVLIGNGVLVKAVRLGTNYKNLLNNTWEIWGAYQSQVVNQDSLINRFYYLKADGNGQTRLLSVNGYINALPFRCWFEGNPGNLLNKPEGWAITDPNDAVSIDDLILTSDDIDIPMYDTSGRLVTTPHKGMIIIKNGKKQLINK